MVKIKNKQVFSTEGKYIHRLGTDTYFRRGTTLPSDTADSFEEVDKLPKYTKEEYNAEVERLIAERYSTGQEIQFARERDSAGQKYTDYLAFVEECKAEARRRLEKREEEI